MGKIMLEQWFFLKYISEKLEIGKMPGEANGSSKEYQISEINSLLEEKQKELIKLANKGQDYEHLADKIDNLREKRQTLLVEDASLSGENERINEMIESIRKNKFRTLEYDDKLVRKIIQSVTVYKEHFLISFKSGNEIEI